MLCGAPGDGGVYTFGDGCFGQIGRPVDDDERQSSEALLSTPGSGSGSGSGGAGAAAAPGADSSSVGHPRSESTYVRFGSLLTEGVRRNESGCAGAGGRRLDCVHVLSFRVCRSGLCPFCFEGDDCIAVLCCAVLCCAVRCCARQGRRLVIAPAHHVSAAGGGIHADATGLG
jgi:hypothetical protein